MTRARLKLAGVIAVLIATGVGASHAKAQALPPELSGDYSDPPPPPRRAPPRRPPPLQETADNPEFGDVGPLPPEFSDTPLDGPAPEEAPEVDADAALPDDEVAAEPTDLDAGPAHDGPRFYVGAGFGVATLAFSRPAEGGAQKLPTTAFAVVDFDVRAHLASNDSLSYEGFAAYQSSMGLVIETAPLFAVPEQVNVRVQRLELSFGPRLKLNDSIALALPAGFAIHLFTPEAHQYPLHPFSLGGMMLRPELIVLFSDRVSVRVGPEFQWLLLLNQSLTREGVCCSGGAIGAQASLQTSLGGVFSLALHYRELRSLVPSAARFTDTERVVTARLLGEL